MNIFSLISPLARILNGTWYSTEASGECQGTDVPGTDACWWRLVETTRTVNATCVNDNLVANVERTAPSCFHACPQLSNRSSSCWVNCLFNTLSGNATATPPTHGMTHAQIVEPFVRSFATDTPAEGGCPDWTASASTGCRLQWEVLHAREL